jgi:integrase
MESKQNTKSQRKALSAKGIEAMKPAGNVLSDVGENSGLRVRCGKLGHKTFYYRYHSPVTEKMAQIKIGTYPVVTLAEARAKLQALKIIRKSGRCPATELKQQKKLNLQVEKESHQVQSFTVEDLVELYLTQSIEDRFVNGKIISGARKPKGQSETRRTLYNDAVRVLGAKQAVDINRKNVVELIMEIVGRGANVQAGNVLRELLAAYEYARNLDKFHDEFANPAGLAKASLKQARVKLTSQRGARYLADAEIKSLLDWLPGSAYTQSQKNILRFTLWTACRTGEVCNAEWKDINLEKGVWHLSETKTGVARDVQLPIQAIDFLKQLKLSTGDYLFPSLRTGKPIQQKSLTEQAWQLRSSGRMVKLEHWTPHDLRRTVRTGLSKLGCRNEVAEAILGHSRTGIEGTYDLHSYEAECKIWLQKWADHLDQLISE